MAVTEPAFKTKREPHLTADLLRQGWHGLKGAVPEWAQRGMQGVEDWGERSSATAAAEGALQALSPADPVEAGLSALGPAAKVGKGTFKAVGGLTALGAGTEDAEAAQGMRRVIYDLIRKHGGDVNKAKMELQGLQPSMSNIDRAQATKMLKADFPPAVVQREMMTMPGQNVHDILHNLRNQTYLKPEQAFGVGDVLAPIAGDTSRAGVNVTQAGIPLKRPVEMQGGHDYGLTKPPEAGVGWASELGAARGKQANFNKAEALVKGPGEVKGVHVAMAPEGSHFAEHTGDLWREMLASGPMIDPRDVRRFDKDVVKQLKALPGGKKPGTNKSRALREWQGVHHPDLSALLSDNPEMRKTLLATASKPGHQHRGFPDIDELYNAALDPTLKTGDAGGAIIRAAPGADLIPGQHNTYGFDIRGQHTGRLEHPVPARMIFNEAADRFKGKPAQFLGSLRMSHHYRPVDQQLIDELSQYSEAKSRALREGSY